MAMELTATGTTTAITTTFNGTLYDRFISFLDASPKTIATYTRALKQFGTWIAVNSITAPTRDTIINYRESLKENHKAATVQSYITVVKLFFRWLASEGLYPDIAAHVKGAKIDKGHKKDALTANQVKAVLNGIDTSTVQGKRDYAIIRLMVTCGLRTIEVSRANIGDLRNSGGVTVLYVQGKGKQDKADFVKVPEATEKAIREYIKAAGRKTSDSPLFASMSNNSKDARLTTRSISAIAKNAFIAVGLDSERLTAHSTRHTAVTLALLNGASLQQAQQFARHSKITTTEIYAHNLERINNPCENLIDTLIA